jgi:hypothetical protein
MKSRKSNNKDFLIPEKELRKIFNELEVFIKDFESHNNQFIKSLGRKAQEDFEELVECFIVVGKIEFVDAPKGHDLGEDCGVFKKVHAEEFCIDVNTDSYTGFLYAKFNEKWIKIPYST